MKIQKIELNGFKSFADKTTFNLHSGITCIVGPNGCGKSNIVDAFRWVLGEQSAKTLRGEKMEEVIFNGSTAKKPKGMADVTLHLSGLNGTSEGNGNGNENTVTVSRRLYRSGESEYLINKNTCRLKDIKDLFLDTGLEVKSYSIIEQGNIGNILNSKPQDRRFLIEEVAGVMKYKVRKAEAQSKLESSKSNLQRINDIILEVKKQIKVLDRLAKKAERYKVLSEELKSIALKINKKEYSELKDMLQKANADYEEARREETSLRASMSTLETDHQNEKIGLIEKERELNALLENFQFMEKAVAEMQKETAVLNSEIESSTRHSTRLSEQLTELDERRTSLNSRILSLTNEKKDLLSQLDDFNASVSEKRDFVSGIEQEMGDIENTIEEGRKDIFRMTEVLSSLNNDLTRFQSAVESMEKKETGYFEEMKDITQKTDAIETEIVSTDSTIVAKNNDLSMLHSRKEDLLNGITGTKEKIESLRNTTASLKEDIASDNSRLVSLREITSEALTTDILAQAEKLHVIGAISDIISVDTRYEKAIEAVLAEKINGFILSSPDDIESTVHFIKKNSLTRAAMMTLESASHKEEPLPSHESVIGRAADFVGTEERFLPIIRNLINNVIIVRDLNAAFELNKTYKNLAFVTPDGDVIDAADTVLSGEGKGILKRKREIKELEESLEEKQSRLERADEELSHLRNMLAQYEQDITVVKEKTVSVEKEISIHKIELRNLHQEKERLQRKKAFIKIEVEQAQLEKENISKNISDIEKTIHETVEKRNHLETSLSSSQRHLKEKKEYYEQYRSTITEIKLKITSYKEKIDALSKEILSLEASVEETEQKKREIEVELEHTHSLIDQKKRSAEETEKKQKDKIVAIDGMRAEISTKKDTMEGITASLTDKEKRIKSLREQTDSIGANLSSLEVGKTEYRLKMENIFNNILQSYGVNIDLFEAEPPLDEEIEKVASLKEKIQSIGPVNLGTIEEYEELKERYAFLTSQQEDLSKSIEELEKAIRKINATTRQRLKEAYVLLNEKFREVFVHLFGGGKAELLLTDEQNILESGIDIIAQPPGKRLQNISLLSGGEKALTALSIIFAGFLIKPAPICMLDEADAPLDETNTDRFAAMIRDLSSDIQFILITHNRTTMETADYIYGITMEEPGTSKVISMQFAEV